MQTPPPGHSLFRVSCGFIHESGKSPAAEKKKHQPWQQHPGPEHAGQHACQRQSQYPHQLPSSRQGRVGTDKPLLRYQLGQKRTSRRIIDLKRADKSDDPYNICFLVAGYPHQPYECIAHAANSFRQFHNRRTFPAVDERREDPLYRPLTRNAKQP